jgi:hypothetical protein
VITLAPLTHTHDHPTNPSHLNSFVYFASGRSYSAAGGGIAGVKASASAVSGKVSGIIRSKLGYELTSTQAYLVLGGVSIAVIALVVQSLFQPPSTVYANAAYMDDDEDLFPSPTPSNSFALKLQEAYDQV